MLGRGDLGLGRAVNFGLESDVVLVSPIYICTEYTEHPLFVECGERLF